MRPMTPAAVYKCVDRGIEWLDKRCPSWVSEIDLDEFDIRSTNTCILGQTAECILGQEIDPGWRYSRYFLVYDKFSRGRIQWSIRRGFSAWRFAEYEMLQIAWTERIRERLASPTLDKLP